MNTHRRSCTGFYHLSALRSPNWKAFCSCSLFLAIYTCIKTLLWATYQCFELWRHAFVFLLLELCRISRNRYFSWRHHYFVNSVSQKSSSESHWEPVISSQKYLAGFLRSTDWNKFYSTTQNWPLPKSRGRTVLKSPWKVLKFLFSAVLVLKFCLTCIESSSLESCLFF